MLSLPASNSAILYCSTACAEDDGVDFKDEPAARRISRDEYESKRAEFGALCPLCGLEYEEF